MSERLTFQYYLIVFLDLLGQRERLRAIGGLPRSDQERNEFIAQIKESVGKIIGLRDGFRNYFESAKTHEPNLELAELIPRAIRQEYKKSLCTAKIEFYGMSDSLVIGVPLMGENENCSAVNGVFAAMVAAAGMHVISLAGKIVLRGGMDVGVGTIIDGRDVYGPALERAVFLEEEVAEYPRVAVGDVLISYLESISGQRCETRLGFVAQDVARRCLSMISTDTDGRRILDFMGKPLVESVSEALTPEVIEMAQRFVVSGHERFTQAGNTKLANRYARLRTYMESRRHLWG